MIQPAEPAAHGVESLVNTPAGAMAGASVARPDMRAQLESWQVYAGLVERIARVSTLSELSFSMANEVWQLFPYTQAYVWHVRGERAALRTVSALARLGEDTPLSNWLSRFGQWLHAHLAKAGTPEPCFVDLTDLPEPLRAGWREWMPAYAYVQPVSGPDGALLGFAAYALDEPPDEAQQRFANRAFDVYGAAFAALAPAGRASGPWRRRIGWAVAVLLFALLFMPVRLSVLAPAEIVGLDAVGVNAPMDGVIDSFAVEPNQPVARDQLLYSLDATTLRNRREVANRQLDIARADALAAAQRSFSNEASRAELASLNGRVAEREAELVLVDDMLARVEVRSPGDGIAVFGDVNDWQGKPVTTGERVVLLANPAQAGLLVWLPVADAINLEPGAEVRMYLQVAPLQPLSAVLFETSYQATASPEGVQAYRLRARFDAATADQTAQVRIGLKGTAKIFGERALLGYYLFRRPLAALRRFTGW